MVLLLPALLACNSGPADTSPGARAVPWSDQAIRLGEGPRGWRWGRSIVHLHSPWSHDACDGEGLIDGEINEPCLMDLRYGLCRAGIDLAFGTDHPSHAANNDYAELLLTRDGDEVVDGIANRIHCDDGGAALWMPGIEDELMPVGLDAHTPDAATRHDLYNQYDAEAVDAFTSAGGLVLVAHTEHRPPEELAPLQAAGLSGVELFNLHAMFDPGIREEDLGLDGWSWISDIGPFLNGETDAEPDLAFLVVYQEQSVSVATWDALSAIAPTVGVGGTDAHQNVLPGPSSDGERFDSYRRMMRWFSNWILVESLDPGPAQEGLAAGRSYTVFEILGTPAGLDVHLESGGEALEVGASAPEGTLQVGCVSLDPESPRGEADPEIAVQIVKDGAAFATGCGAHALTEPGVYRVVYEIVPHHLEPFLADQAEALVKPYPWIYSNAVRIGLD